jgi:hypothetical protein
MALTKLTLSVDEELVRKARDYSQRHETSISQLVSRFLERLPGPDQEYTPIVQRLRGILSPDVDVSDYHRHLEEKHGL